MGSAFTPVHPRGSSPMPIGGLHHGGLSRPNKRTHEHVVPTLQQMALDDIDEEQTEVTAPDHVSTSASESSSKASNNSQPALLDFIGNTCMASAWFTSCFPCAVVDINDSDEYVVDKLSRESAMNVMYAKKERPATSAGAAVSPEGSLLSDVKPSESDDSEGQDNNVILVRLPESEDVPQNDASIYSISSALEEEDSQDDETAMDTISLTDDAGSVPMAHERMDSGIVDHRESPLYDYAASEASMDEVPISSQPKSPPKKKKKFGMKLFGRKKRT